MTLYRYQTALARPIQRHNLCQLPLTQQPAVDRQSPSQQPISLCRFFDDFYISAAMSNIWSQISQTVATEFSDIDDVPQATRLVLRLGLAALLGGLLGWQREVEGKDAGLRTHMLVAMGSALFVLLAQQSGMDTSNVSRVLQGVIAGVGFIGAGAILKGEDNSSTHVKGLTSAAGIWLTAAIGIAAGIGEETTALISAVFCWLILSALPWLLRKGTARNPPSSAATTPTSENSRQSGP